jgi:WD40 repeat protein
VGSPLKHNGSVSAVAFSPDGQTVLTGNKVFELSGSSLATLSKAVLNPTGEARLWDVLTGMPLGEPMKCGQSVNTVAFSPDGQTLLTGSGGLVQVWPIPAPAIDDRVESKRSQLSVEVRTWKRLDANGEVIRLTFNEWNERRKELKTLDGPCDRPSWDEYKAWKTNREK